MDKISILVVEDEPLARRILAERLIEHRIDFAADFDTARKKIESGEHDICFIDLKLGQNDDCSGLKLIPLATARNMYTVVMSGHDSQERVEKAYELGCDDFYAKGNESANVCTVLSRFLQKRQKPEEERLFDQDFITKDEDLRRTLREGLKYAASQLPMLILGPSGSGKTSLARIIHERSERPGEFVAINCSAYTENLLEAELFGYKRGAFTGAVDSRKGKLLLADQGTLFLDEIGSMSLKMQAKLLKAIEEGSFYPLGSEKPETSRFRIISATLEDVQALFEAGRLRFDFFQRIHGITINLKPLAQRKDDLCPLIEHFTHGGRRLSFTTEAKERLLRHDWPGNVRELKKFVELLSAGEQGLIGTEEASKALASLAIEEGGGFVTEQQYRFAKTQGLNAAVRRFVDVIIQRSMTEHRGKKADVLKDLGIANRILYTSLKRSNPRRTS